MMDMGKRSRWSAFSGVRRPRGCWVLLAFALCLCLYGCSPAVVPTPEPVTIVFGFPDAFMEQAYQELADDFHSLHPQVTVELRPRFRGRPAELGGDSAPDVFLAAPDSGLFESGAALDLKPLLEDDPEVDAEDYYPRILDAYRWQDKVYAIPAEVDVMVMYYNKDIFDRLAVPHPTPNWTWTDFLETAKEILRASKDTVFPFASDPVSVDAVPWVYQHGAQLVDNLAEPTRFNVDDPLVAEAIQWYADLALVHDVMPTITEMRGSFPEGPRQGFLMNNVAMFMGILTDRGGTSWGVDWPFGWGAVALPRDRYQSTVLTTRGLFVNASTDHRRESWQWIVYLSERPSVWALPAKRSVAGSPETARHLGEELTPVALDAMGYALPPFTVDPRFWQVGEWFVQGIAGVVEGRVTADEMLNGLKPRLDEFLGQ